MRRSRDDPAGLRFRPGASAGLFDHLVILNKTQRTGQSAIAATGDFWNCIRLVADADQERRPRRGVSF
jgi:hypothetical protein